MCLIIQTSKEKPVSEALMRNWQKKNNDGWGMMWIKDNQIHHTTSIEPVESLYSKYQELQEYDPVIHLRWQTHGDHSLNNCHPFYCGHGILMMHNGVISIVRSDLDKSDTRTFVEEFITPLFNSVTNPHEFMRTPTFHKLMHHLVGYSNRLIFGDRGGFVIINERDWYTIKVKETGQEGTLVSNSYAWNENDFLPKVYQYGNGKTQLSKKERKRLAKQMRLSLVGGKPGFSANDNTYTDPQGHTWIWSAAKGIYVSASLPMSVTTVIPHNSQLLTNSLGQLMFLVIGNIYEDVDRKVWIYNTIQGKFWRESNLDGKTDQIKASAKKREEEKTKATQVETITTPPVALLSGPKIISDIAALRSPLEEIDPPGNRDEVALVIIENTGKATDQELDERDEQFQSLQSLTNSEYADILVKEWRNESSGAIHSMTYTNPDDAAKVICRLMGKV